MKIVVLTGGISTERDVSLSSGSLIYRALKERGHQAILLDVFLGYEGDDADNIFEKDCDWAAEIGHISEESPDIEQIKALRPDWKKNFFGPNVISICQAADVVFMGLHGENGENGRIQACFDLMGICYTGTDYVSSALCMDKGLAKELFAVHGIPTPRGFRLKKDGLEEHLAEGGVIPFPLVVKACCGGSSVGVYMVDREEEYERALREAFRYDGEVIVEVPEKTGFPEGARFFRDINRQTFTAYRSRRRYCAHVLPVPHPPSPREHNKNAHGPADTALPVTAHRCF